MGEWKERPIHELCSSIIDCVNKTAPVVEGPTPYKMIRTTNVRRGQVDVTNVRHVSEQTYRRWVRRGVPENGDIILTREAPLGEVGMLRDARGVFLGQRLVMYRADPKQVDRDFLLYAMQGPDVRAQIDAYGAGATVAHMRVPDCGALVVACPELRDQRRIGRILGAFDDLVAANERRIACIESLVRSVHQEWFVWFRFPGHEDVALVDSPLGQIPEGWDAVRLGEAVTLRYGKSLPVKARRPGSGAVVSSAGIVGEHDKPLLPGPGVVLGRKGNVGSVWWIDRPYFPIDTTYYVETDWPLGLIYWQLQGLAFIDSHAAVPGLSRDQANGLLILRPPRALADQFDLLHRDCFAAIASLRCRNSVLLRTRDLLLPRLVSGRLDVSDVDLGELLNGVEAA